MARQTRKKFSMQHKLSLQVTLQTYDDIVEAAEAFDFQTPRQAKKFFRYLIKQAHQYVKTCPRTFHEIC